MFPIRSKADAGYNAFVEFTKSYNDATYGFSPVDLGDLPSGYSFNPNVINYVIERAGRGFNYNLANRTGFVVLDWEIDQTFNFVNWVFGSIVNAYIATASFVQDYVYTGAEAYRWYYSFTGADERYNGWDTYGTAYGFRFEGICGDKIDLVLDSQGNFYGLNPLGNITFDQQTEPYDYIQIHQGNNDPTDPEFYAPSYSITSFEDLKQPYIEGIKLHFFQYAQNNTEMNHFIINDFRDTSLLGSITTSGNYKYYNYQFISDHYMSGSVNGSNFSFINTTGQYTINNQNLNVSGRSMFSSLLQFHTSGSQVFTCVLPFYKLSSGNYIGTYDALGFYNNEFVNGYSNIYLKTFSYSPNVNPQAIPEDPIPITEIPDDPEEPIPSSNPDPVPGITYPEPDPVPLPPFATIVSGNDELWGETIELQGLENSLLPYLGSLGQFNFPSFSELLTEYTGSIIWVAQIMSLLYNGTPLNILFIVLCLFSLVSILIGAYKLWSSTEPDPQNGGRRYKRPPKGGKKH